MPRNGTEYKILNTNNRYKCRQAKDEWFNENFAEIKKLRNIDIASMHKRINEITEQKMYFSARCIKCKKLMLIIEKENILKTNTLDNTSMMIWINLQYIKA